MASECSDFNVVCTLFLEPLCDELLCQYRGGKLQTLAIEIKLKREFESVYTLYY